LNALVDGNLERDRELDVRRHLDLCATCRSGLAAVTVVKQAVGRAYAAESPSPGLRRAVLAQLPKRRSGWRWWLAPAAALLLLTAGIGVWRWHRAAQPIALTTSLPADQRGNGIMSVETQPVQSEVAPTAPSSL
jgi:anti-sigma factor RsiW